MRLSRATVMFAFCLECVISAPGTAADVLPAVVSAPRYAPAGSLLANCTETAMLTEPVPAKPAARKPTPRKHVAKRKHAPRKTVAARPHVAAHKAVTKKPIHKVVAKKSATPVKHKAVHKRPVHHRPRHRAVAHKAAPRPIVHRVTYASPICDSRAPVIDQLLGLTGLPELPPFDGPILPGPDEETAKAFAALLPNAPAPQSFPRQSFPFFPGAFGFPFPGGPGGGGGDTPPGGGGGGTPPPTVAVPEPASWAMMILGLGMAGYVIRRRRRSRRDRESQAL
jgi:hypothetical protein